MRDTGSLVQVIRNGQILVIIKDIVKRNGNRFDITCGDGGMRKRLGTIVLSFRNLGDPKESIKQRDFLSLEFSGEV